MSLLLNLTKFKHSSYILETMKFPIRKDKNTQFMYGTNLDELQTMMNDIVKRERRLDQKCSDLSSLCRTLLSGMRDAMSHTTLDYDQRKREKQLMNDLFDSVGSDLVDVKMKQDEVIDHG